MKVEDADVIVVGAGPAGISTAYHLNDSGLEVIVFERSYNPRSKPCAGLIQAEALEDFPILRNAPKISIEQVIVTYDDNDYEVEFEEPIAYTIDRVSAGRRFVGRMDAELELGVSVIDVRREDDRRLVEVIRPDGERETYRSRYLVGADGAISLVRRKLKLPEWIDDLTIGSAYQAKVSGYYEARLLLGKWAPKGYAWVYPRPTGESVFGIGTLKRYSLGSRDRLFEILKLYDIETYEQQFGYVPLVGLVKETSKDNALLVGDAAGQVQPINGMGIYYALKAGRYAAEAIRKEEIERYEKSRRSDFGKELKLGRKALEKSLKSKTKRFSNRLARITAEILMGRVSARNLLKARLILKLGL